MHLLMVDDTFMESYYKHSCTLCRKTDLIKLPLQ